MAIATADSAPSDGFVSRLWVPIHAPLTIAEYLFRFLTMVNGGLIQYQDDGWIDWTSRSCSWRPGDMECDTAAASPGHSSRVRQLRERTTISCRGSWSSSSEARDVSVCVNFRFDEILTVAFEVSSTPRIMHHEHVAPNSFHSFQDGHRQFSSSEAGRQPPSRAEVLSAAASPISTWVDFSRRFRWLAAGFFRCS